jgi:hypothetical protein
MRGSIPCSWSHPGKVEVRIFDYVDRNVPMLLRMFEKRLRGYRAIGYRNAGSQIGSRAPDSQAGIELTEEPPDWEKRSWPRGS